MKSTILNIKINSLSKPEVLACLEKFLDSPAPHHLVTANPEILMASQKDQEYANILNRADLVLPDGVGLIYAGKVLGQKIKERITGSQLVDFLCELCQAKGKSIYLLGGSRGVAGATAKKLQSRYPGLKIVGANEGGQITNSELRTLNYELRTTDVERRRSSEFRVHSSELITKINKTKPDVLLVAFGHPKQEKWIYYNLPRLTTVKIAAGVGGTFDFISGRIKRAPQVMQALGLEWLWRLFKEPERLDRIITATWRFSTAVLCAKIQSVKGDDFCRDSALRMFLTRKLCGTMRNLCGNFLGEEGKGSKKYRRNVLGVILNKKNEILLVSRYDDPKHWQFPQGGVNEGEKEETALLREMKEELGTDNFEIIKKLDQKHCYPWPKNVQAHYQNKYQGQCQTIFILRLEDKDIDFSQAETKEFVAHQWVKAEGLLEKVHPVRREVAKIVYEYLANQSRIKDSA